jgi:oxygen-independent coproporphyrinogen-3 oxidase
MGRLHGPEGATDAVRRARAAGLANLSVDLIFALPEGVRRSWTDDLERALALEVPHLSLYGLTVEQGTPLGRRVAEGRDPPVDDARYREEYLEAAETLARAGYLHYEVSNFARPGDESQHNLAYWRSDQWLAAGPSASAHVAGWRWKNAPRLDDYLNGEDAGLAPALDVEPPNPARALIERIMMGVRVREGLDRATIANEARAARGEAAADAIAREAQALETEGVLAPDPARIRLTERGFLLADLAARRLVTPVSTGSSA